MLPVAELLSVGSDPLDLSICANLRDKHHHSTSALRNVIAIGQRK